MPEYINLENIFLVVSVFSTIFYILKMLIFLFIGGDMEVQADFDTLCDADPSFNFLSVQSVLAFFMGFGWFGLTALTQLKAGVVLSFVLALIFGLFIMFISAWLMFLVNKLNKRVVINLEECVGTVGKAYTDLNPHSEGQIEITINNKLEIMNALNITDEKIDAFTQVKVEKVENNILYVVKN